MPQKPDLQRRAALAERAAGLTAIALLALVAAEKLSPPVMAALRKNEFDAQSFAVGLAQVLPAAAFTVALWALRKMFAGVAAGKTFTNELPRALRTAGWALTAGAVAGVVLEPIAMTLLGKGPGYLIALDAGAIAIGAVGVGLVALSALLREAVAMKSELDGFM